MDYGPRTTDHERMKKALITGITGQDGSYLAEWLLENGYEVHGIVRRSSTENFDRIAHLSGRITLHQADLLDQLSIIDVLREVRPAELYNLAADPWEIKNLAADAAYSERLKSLRGDLDAWMKDLGDRGLATERALPGSSSGMPLSSTAYCRQPPESPAAEAASCCARVPTSSLPTTLRSLSCERPR